MKGILYSALLAGALMLTPAINAQEADRYRAVANDVVDRTIQDLHDVGFHARLKGDDRDHANEAAEKLSKFQADAHNGKFNKDKLDDSIRELRKLVKSDKIYGADRDRLTSDLNALRDLRANRDVAPTSRTEGAYRP